MNLLLVKTATFLPVGIRLQADHQRTVQVPSSNFMNEIWNLKKLEPGFPLLTLSEHDRILVDEIRRGSQN